jgi:hypothetical protein
MQPVAFDISPNWVSSFGLGGSVRPARIAPISAILAVPLARSKRLDMAALGFLAAISLVALGPLTLLKEPRA